MTLAGLGADMADKTLRGLGTGNLEVRGKIVYFCAAVARVLCLVYAL